jgi:alkylation response protein AidB-like acyl-CoA dehydrogenase
VELHDTPEEAAFRSRARAWLGEHRGDAPRFNDIPSEAQIEQWRAWSLTLFEAGFAGITWPTEYGGQGLSHMHQAIWLQEIARSGVPDHLGLIGVGMAGPTIITWGTEEQKRRFLRPLLRCDEIWCQGFSEPGSGSDLASARTFARLEGEVWVVSGQKVWSSFAHLAQWCILLVRTDRDAPKHAGLSYLLLDMSSPGVEVVPLPQLTGDPEFNEIFLTDVRVARTAMLGVPGDGWKVAMTTLSHERGTHGVGLAAQLDAEMRRAIGVLARPQADGSCAANDPAVRDRLAEIWIELQGLRMANLRALSAMAETGVPGPGSTIAKLHWSELNQALARLMTEALGPAGTELGADAVDGGHWSFARLRARGNTIEAGTSEVLRNIIAERVLGLPRAR